MAFGAPIDLRSDTATLPSAAMRAAMSTAAVGDAQKGEDPTVTRLEERVAELLDIPHTMYVPSATMANQIAVGVHTNPGGSVVVERTSHVVTLEAGGMSALAGAMPLLVEADRGVISERTVRTAAGSGTLPGSRAQLLWIENTHAASGGNVWPDATLTAATSAAHAAGMRAHVDGARLFNAAAALGVPPDRIVRDVDSVTICLSKGLGAPFGALLAVRDADTAERARQWRQRLGGALRQAGVVAAAGLYALDHHRESLSQDHDRIRRLATVLEESGITPESPPETNIVFYRVPEGSVPDVVAGAARNGVLISDYGRTDAVRIVTHRDISDEDVDTAARILSRVI